MKEKGEVVSTAATFVTSSSRSTARAQGAQPSTRLSLTRRGRLVCAALALVCTIALLTMIAVFGGAQALASGEHGGSEFSYVLVQPGASLWQLAHELDPDTDPRDLVAEIVRLNQLTDSSVQAGQRLAVPLRYADAEGVIV